MSNLYDLSNELALIHDEIISADGEISESLEVRLDDCRLAFRDKADGIVRWIANLDGKEEAIEKEIARLQARKKVTQNLQARLKEYVKASMILADVTKMELPTVTLSLQNNPPSAEILDNVIIPSRYLTIIPEQMVVNKKAVLDDLKKGVEIPGTRLADKKTHIRIR